MIDMETIKPALISWMEGVGVQAVFANDKRPSLRATGLNPGVLALLDVPVIADNGIDQLGWQEAEPGSDNLLARVAGIRHMTVSCRIESFSHTPGSEAQFFCEKARTRLRMPRTILALQEAGLAQIESTPTVNLPRLRSDDGRSDRMLSAAAFDVRFAVLAEETETSEGALGTIGSIEVRSNDFKNVDGNNTAEQMDETITEP